MWAGRLLGIGENYYVISGGGSSSPGHYILRILSDGMVDDPEFCFPFRLLDIGEIGTTTAGVVSIACNSVQPSVVIASLQMYQSEMSGHACDASLTCFSAAAPLHPFWWRLMLRGRGLASSSCGPPRVVGGGCSSSGRLERPLRTLVHSVCLPELSGNAGYASSSWYHRDLE